MLTYDQRIARYFAQTGRSPRLTARQNRRLKHKHGHQSAAAVESRAERSIARQAARAASKARRTALLPTS